MAFRLPDGSGLGIGMASTKGSRTLIEAVAAEMTTGIQCAVDYWMGQIESVFNDANMTTLGRLQAVKEILKTYQVEQSGEPIQGRGHAA
jgi:hypothetical protein